MNHQLVETDFSRPIQLGHQVYWVGFWDSEAGLSCNPYLVVDGDEAVLIDGGSRPDFSTMMMKVMQAGVSPRQIRALIYQHYDPDLCGSIPSLEDIIARDDLELISARPNHMFIRHYSANSKMRSFQDIDYRFRFSSGRELLFATTPYAHSLGSSIAFDPTSGILFSSDLLGNSVRDRSLFLTFSDACRACAGRHPCPQHPQKCPFHQVLMFQQLQFPCFRALQHAIEKIRGFPFEMIAPQHGSIISVSQDAMALLERMLEIKGVGIDGMLDGNPAFSGEIW